VKRSAVLSIALLGVLRALPAAALQTGKTYRVGILSTRTAAYDRPLVDAFRRALSGLGYQEGKNLEIIYRDSGGNDRRLPALAVDLLRTQPDAIVAAGDPAVAAARRATTTIPIVMSPGGDPVGGGFIASLERPGGIITGLTTIPVELVGKDIQLLKELVPRLRRVAVIGNLSNPSDVAEWRAAESVARTGGLTVFSIDVRNAEQIEAALKPHLHADAILVLTDGLMFSNAERIVRLAAAQRLPAYCPTSAFVVAGGLISYGPSATGMWSQAATYVDKILKGANPADLPVEQPTVFDLVVNLKTARSLGITVPQSILLSADEVIK